MAYFWLLLRNVGGRRKDGRKAKTLRNPARGSRLSRFGFENAEKSLAGLATGGPFPPDAFVVRVRNHHRHRCGFSIAESESVSKQQQQQRKKSEETEGNVSTPVGPEWLRVRAELFPERVSWICAMGRANELRFRRIRSCV